MCVCVFIFMVKSHNIIMCVPVTHTYTHALELYIRGITHQIKIALQVFFLFFIFFGCSATWRMRNFSRFPHQTAGAGKVQQY